MKHRKLNQIHNTHTKSNAKIQAKPKPNQSQTKSKRIYRKRKNLRATVNKRQRATNCVHECVCHTYCVCVCVSAFLVGETRQSEIDKTWLNECVVRRVCVCVTAKTDDRQGIFARFPPYTFTFSNFCVATKERIERNYLGFYVNETKLKEWIENKSVSTKLNCKRCIRIYES